MTFKCINASAWPRLLSFFLWLALSLINRHLLSSLAPHMFVCQDMHTKCQTGKCAKMKIDLTAKSEAYKTTKKGNSALIYLAVPAGSCFHIVSATRQVNDICLIWNSKSLPWKPHKCEMRVSFSCGKYSVFPVETLLPHVACIIINKN